MLIGGKPSSQDFKIANAIKHITKEEALRDFENLMTIEPKQKDLTKLTGNKFVNYYMFPYRLDTKCNRRKNANFYEFYHDPSSYLTSHALTFYKQSLKNGRSKKNTTRQYKSYDFFTNWFCNVVIFKPLVSKYLYQVYQPHTILDISMGWGGRLIGAMSIPDIHYIGFDTNIDLKEPYQKMIRDLDHFSPDLNVKKRTTLLFEDSSNADLSKFRYDMVFTSPPYFIKGSNKGIEGYPHVPAYNSYDDWTKRFFNPVMSNAWKHMEKGGVFCINTNSTDFELLKKLFGKPDQKINIKNHKRQASSKTIVSSEYIYIWKK